MESKFNDIVLFLEEKGAFKLPIGEIKEYMKEYFQLNESRATTTGSSGIHVNKTILPYCGRVFEDNCKGIKSVHTLFIQCNKKPDNGEYCASCEKQTLGNIKDRGSSDWRDSRGRKPARYENVAEKLGIDLGEAVKYADSIGLEIPPLELIKEVKRRGRPKKNVSDSKASESESKTNDPDTKPDKNKKQSLSKQIDQLIKEVDEELSEEEIIEINKSQLEEISVSGTTYYIYKDPKLMDPNQRIMFNSDLTPHGCYDIKTEKISTYDME